MNEDDATPGHRRQLAIAFDLIELLTALFERSRGVSVVVFVQQSVMLREDVLLDVPTVEEDHVTPKLSATQRLH